MPKTEMMAGRRCGRSGRGMALLLGVAWSLLTGGAASVSELFNGQTLTGDGTYYGSGHESVGACQLAGTVPPGYIGAALNGVYHGGDSEDATCGLCLRLTGEGEGLGTDPIIGPYNVYIYDVCGGCKRGSVDLGINGDGRWKVSWMAVPCPLTRLRMRFEGSNMYYLRIQPRGLDSPVVDVTIDGQRLARSVNFWSRSGKVITPFTAVVTTATGQVVEMTVPRIVANGEVDVTTTPVSNPQPVLQPNPTPVLLPLPPPNPQPVPQPISTPDPIQQPGGGRDFTCCYWPPGSCGSCVSGEVASSWCGESSVRCAGCGGTYCAVNAGGSGGGSAVADPQRGLVFGSQPDPQPQPVFITKPDPTPEPAVPQGAEFPCCYHAPEGSPDTCGYCANGAGPSEWCGAGQDRCEGNCGGVWCGSNDDDFIQSATSNGGSSGGGSFWDTLFGRR